MEEKYVFQLKAKTDEVFKITTSTLSYRFGESKEDIDKTIQVPVDGYSLAFNSLHHDFTVKLGSRPIFQTGLFNVSTIIEISVFLVTTGFYYSANSELRNALDYFITSMYFDILEMKDELPEYWVDEANNFISWKKKDVEIPLGQIGNLQKYLVIPITSPKKNCKRTTAYTQWLLGKRYVKPIRKDKSSLKCTNFPSKEESLGVIFKEQYFKLYNVSFQLEKQIDDFYVKLSKYTHNRPEKTSINLKSSVFNIRYNQKEFEQWFEHLKELYEVVLILTILQYPKLLEVGSYEIKRFKKWKPELFSKITNVLKPT